MQRVSLVPRYYGDWNKTKLLIPVAVILVLAALGGVLFIKAQKESLLKEREEKLAEVQAEQTRVQQILADAQAIEQEIQPIVNLTKFCGQFETVNGRYSDVFEAVSRYIWDDYTIDSLSIADGSSVSFSVELPNFEQALRFCYNIDRCTMPAEEGGTEPLWSVDGMTTSPARRPLVSGWSIGGSGSTASQLVSQVTNGEIMSGWSSPLPGIVYEDSVLLTFTGALLEPIKVSTVADFGPPPPPPPDPAAAMGGGGGMGGPAGGAPAPAAAAGGGDDGAGGDE